MPLLSVSQLSKTYRKGNNQIHALRDVSFTVEQGEFVSIVGRSGSGKSTLLNIIGGLDTASSGQILFAGTDMAEMKRSELARHRCVSVGMVFQSFNLIPHRSALENVILALTFGGVPRRERQGKAAGLLRQVGLEHRLHHKPSEMSGGEAQRVAIARALANNPPMLLPDEPTGNLDSTTAREIIDLLQDLNHAQGVTIVMVTHEQDMAAAVSGKIIRLLDGRIVTGREGAAG